jgi:hypothetical protein
MIKVPRLLFALSMLAMGWWVFLWPFAVSNDSDHAMLRSGCIWTLLLFFGSLIALLSYRIHNRKPSRTT